MNVERCARGPQGNGIAIEVAEELAGAADRITTRAEHHTTGVPE